MAIYIKISDIKGSVTTKGFEDWIACTTCSYSVNRETRMVVGNMDNREYQKPSFEEFSIHRKVDQASPYLLQVACEAKAIPTLEIVVCTKSSDTSPYLKYKLTDAIISSRSLDFSDGEQKPIETLSISFAKIEETYIPRDSTNRAKSPITVGYDLEEAKVM